MCCCVFVVCWLRVWLLVDACVLCVCCLRVVWSFFGVCVVIVGCVFVVCLLIACYPRAMWLRPGCCSRVACFLIVCGW